MAQIIGAKAKPIRCNLQSLSDVGTPSAGQYVLVSSDNSMQSDGQGNFDCYIVGNGSTAATDLTLNYITASDALSLTEFLSLNVETGANMINPDDYTNGYYIYSVTGEPYANVKWSCTPFIAVDESKTYTFRGINNSGSTRSMPYVDWYNSSKTHLSQSSGVSSMAPPSGAAYCRCSTYNATQNYNKLTLTGMFEGASATFEEYYELKNLNYEDTQTYDGKPSKSLVNKGDVEDIKTELTTSISELDNAKAVTDCFEVVNITGDNLINPDDYINGYYVLGGVLTAADNFSVTPYIAVSANTYMTFFGVNNSGSQGTMRYISWFDESYTYLSQDEATQHATSPSSAAYMRCSTYNATQDYTKLVLTGAYVGSHGYEAYYSTPYIAYNSEAAMAEAGGNAIIKKSDLLEYVPDGFTATRTGDSLVMTTSDGNTMLFYTSANSNDVANYWTATIGEREITNSDDAAPMHIYSTTIGANHGFVGYAATIASHGLDDTSVGTAWTMGGVTYYLMEVTDSNTLVFISENSGTRTNPTRTALSTGTLSDGSTSLTVTSVETTQVHPSIKNRTYSVYMNGKLMDGDFSGVAKSIEIVESYDIMNLDDVIDNLVANVGTSSPEYSGDAVVSVRNTYHFNKNLSSVVIGTYRFKEDVRLTDIMFSQHGVNSATSVYYFVPNSNTINGYDLKTPTLVSWGSLSAFLFDSTTWVDENNPVNRVIEMVDGQGMAIGYVPVGLGANLSNYTSATFSINGSTGKIYPHGVDSDVVGTTATAGSVYSAALYRAFINESTTGRYSSYYYEYNGATYVYVDYSASMVDTIEIGAEYNGKSASVVESKNTELLSDIYNNGIDVNATFVSGESCFIVLKLQ